MSKYKTGVDALDFLNEILQDEDLETLKAIDTIIWDPPYLKKAGLKNSWKNAHGPFITDRVPAEYYISNDRIYLIKDALLKIFTKAKWIRFHTNIDEIDTKEKVIIWYKPDVPEDNMIGNVEYVELSNVKNCGIYFKSKVYEIPREKNTRSMCKPSKLYEKLFKLINSKCVLDLFAGYGNSIKVCKSMNIPIFACDIDSRLKPIWEGHIQQSNLEEWI